jgi:hypothetical protein
MTATEQEQVTEFAVGDRVVIEGYAFGFDGKIGDVSAVSGRTVVVSFDYDQEVPTNPGGFDLQYVRRVEQVPEDASAIPTVQDWATAKERIAALEREADEARALAAQRRAEHEADIETINEVFTEKANRAGYCSDYDEVVETANGQLHIPLAGRLQERDFTVSVRAHYDVSVTVSAMSAEEAERMVEDSDYRNTIDSQVSGVYPESWEITDVEEG